MHVFQTWGVPPRRGRTSLPIMGWTRNSKKALTNRVAAKNGRAKGLPPGQARPDCGASVGQDGGAAVGAGHKYRSPRGRPVGLGDVRSPVAKENVWSEPGRGNRPEQVGWSTACRRWQNRGD